MTSKIRNLALGCSLAALGALAAVPGLTQSPELTLGTRAMVHETGLEGIDRGLRAQGVPMEPGHAGRRSAATPNRPDGVVPHRVYARGSVIVKFHGSAEGSAVASAMREVRGSRLHQPSDADFHIIDIPLDADPEAVSAELLNDPNVEYAQPRYVNYAMLRPNDPLYDRQWNWPAIDMERAWDVQPAAGDQITVAVLDTGVAFRTATMRYFSTTPFNVVPGGPVFPPMGVVDVPFAVAPELGSAKFVAPRNFIWNDNLPFDLDGHGTHVSGTVGQLTNNGVGVAGMAYNVRIMPVKVLDDIWDDIFNSPFTGTDDVLARGIRYAADNGANVINMSLGRTGGGPALAVEDAIRYAVSRGVFVVVSAGNEAEEGNPPNRTAEAAPRIDGMVAVGAVGRGLQRAYYSTTNAYVELAAPGGDQRRDGTSGGVLQQTLDPDLLHTYELGPQRITPPRADSFVYEFLQGTSMAAPHVSAFAAMLMQQGITSPAAVEAAMKQFARDLGPAGVDREYGHGLIQPRATLRGLGIAR